MNPRLIIQRSSSDINLLAVNNNDVDTMDLDLLLQ